MSPLFHHLEMMLLEVAWSSQRFLFLWVEYPRSSAEVSLPVALFLFFAFGYETGMGQLGGNVHLIWTAPGVGAHIQGEQISQSDISGSLNNSGLYQFFHQESWSPSSRRPGNSNREKHHERSNKSDPYVGISRDSMTTRYARELFLDAAANLI